MKLSGGLLSRQSRTGVTLLGFLSLGVIGVLDYLTGIEISFSLFYLIPIGLVTWFAGKTEGVVLGFLSALVWLVSDLSWPDGPDPIILYWNALVRLGLFIVFVQLLAIARARHEELEEEVRARTERLLKEMAEHKESDMERGRLVERLQGALDKVNMLSGLLPICASCKRIRDDRGYWNQIESYIQEHSEAEFTHGICPECAQKLYPGLKISSQSPSGEDA